MQNKAAYVFLHYCSLTRVDCQISILISLSHREAHMFVALLHHISQYTSIGDCGQQNTVQSESWVKCSFHRTGYGIASDVCVICLAPSGSSVINLANQTNPDINYIDLIATRLPPISRFQTNNNILYFQKYYCSNNQTRSQIYITMMSGHLLKITLFIASVYTLVLLFYVSSLCSF